MKVVINNCFGGFSLSPRGVQRLAELKGRPCFFFKKAIAWGSPYVPITIDEAESEYIAWAFDVPNPNDVLREHSDPANANGWHGLTLEQRREHNARYEAHRLPNREVGRHDPHLVQVVEELGKVANGICADLKVVEIPDGVDYVIEEYDGNEHIAEQHRTWS